MQFYRAFRLKYRQKPLNSLWFLFKGNDPTTMILTTFIVTILCFNVSVQKYSF